MLPHQPVDEVVEVGAGLLRPHQVDLTAPSELHWRPAPSELHRRPANHPIHPGTGRHKNPRLELVSPSQCSTACEWCQELLPLLPVLGVEHLGTLDQYLGICQIGVHDHHTRILLEHYKITHWTYFRRVHPDTLLMLKFAEGPAQQLCDGMALWVATLQKNRREIENEVEYASNR
ncbi:hypothetical protein PtA15_18A285 [Puccinia triticina]|uniref:Uncharacterized protein n=1 Tax=Puccinia triticina TaxID=208348 RepID=A0ABY7DA79_9BASI|nr:uncharacterized protein PtA15_18A285 [Puccinia triticina]WAQ93227.1 hypothetical protein PtA15_18A285 [Puccinia triticina]